MLKGVPQIILLLILVDLATAFIFNGTDDLFDNDLDPIKTRRQGRKPKSTSSSRSRKGGSKGGKVKSASDTGESLGDSVSEESSDDSIGLKKRDRVKADRIPKSSAGRRGWKKWHRKCTQCPTEMRKKWRDPSIKWICGAYQRARRSFKSLCMMHFRNCQDGTMFTKIADHRCSEPDGNVRPHGEHFFYDYEVALTDDSEESSDSKDSDEDADPASSSSWSSDKIRTIPTPPGRINKED